MKISTKGRYGLRLMLELALHYEKGNIPLKEISQSQEISDKYLEQIINQLNKSGLVKSTRGSQGGYILSRKPEEIYIGEILRVLEGSLSPVVCTEDNGKTCSRSPDCLTFSLWSELKDAIESVVDNKTLMDLISNKNCN